jgi:hypothetical protein
MKKVALILFGISYEKNLNHWTGANYIIDFRKSFENYKKYIYNYFNNLGYEIDTYWSPFIYLGQTAGFLSTWFNSQLAFLTGNCFNI